MATGVRLLGMLAVLAIGGVTMLDPQDSAGAGLASRPAVNLHCTLSGGAKDAARLTRGAVCARFVQAIESALQVRLVETDKAPGPKGRWIELRIKLGTPAHAEAAFTSRLGGTVRNHVPIGIDVMDKPLDLREIDMLAGQVAELLRKQG